MKNNKKLILIIIAIVLIGLIFSFFMFFLNRANNQNQFVIMSTTDVHGKIWEKNVESGKEEKNNLLAASTAVAKARDAYGNNTVLFDNGDLYQGTVLSTIDIPQKYTDYDTTINPTTLCLMHMKYDGHTLGNHEFNYPYSQMKEQYSILEKEGIKLVCANIYYPGNNERVFDPYMIKELNVDGTKVKVGIIGIENTDVPRWDTAGHYNSWIFHSQENPNADVSYEIQKAKNEMIANGDECDLTIVSYHGGFFAEGSTNPSDYEDYATKLENKMQKEPLELYKNTESQGYRAVRKSSGIDMFILGHDHTDLYSNTQYKNADGKDVLVVNGAKKDLTQTVFELVKDNESQKPKIKLVSSNNLHFSDYDSDKPLRKKIMPYATSAIKLLENEITRIKGNWDFDDENNETFIKQTDSVDLVNRAQLWYSRKFLRRKFENNAQVNKYINFWMPHKEGLCFDENEPVDADLSVSGSASTSLPSSSKKTLTFNDISSLYAYDNEITFCPVSGRTIKDILEFNASDRYAVETDKDGNKKIVTIKDRYTCPIFYGINFTYDMTKEPGNRVQIEGFSNGKAFDLNKTYCMVLNNYLLGNTSNPIFGKIDSDQELIDTAIDGPRELCRNAIVFYVYEKEKNDGGIYPTNEAEKNGDTKSHWSFKY